MTSHLSAFQFDGRRIFAVGAEGFLPSTFFDSLEAEGLVVETVVDAAALLLGASYASAQLIILDIGIKNPEIFALTREIRKSSYIPIVALAEQSSELDEAMLFAAGGDEFIVKSISSRIFALRIAALLRRAQASTRDSAQILSAGGLVLDLNTRSVQFDDGEVAVTRTEFDFLKLLMERPRKVFTREEVIAAIGGAGDFSNDHFLDTHASRLRLKIKAAGGPKVITAVRGVGYRLIASQGLSESAVSE